VLLDLARTHSRVAVDFLVGTKAGLLPLARTSHPIADRGRTFFRARARDIAVFHRGNFDVQIDTIEQRSGNSLPSALDLERPTSAFAFQITEVSAGARIQARVHLSMKIRLTRAVASDYDS
jgi:hypothetical protein